MRRASALLTVALLLCCATPGETKKEAEAPPPPKPISGKVTAAGAPAPGARVVVTRHRPGLGTEPPCACEDHPSHALALCLAPESSEKLAALVRTEPEAAPVAEVTTGPDGEFTTPPLPEGRYDLRAELREGLGWKASVGAGARAAEVSLRATAPIRGQVRTAGGAEVVGGAEIVVSAGDARIVRVAVANAAGDFEVPRVPLGGALVIASTPGLTPAKGLPAPAAAEDGSLGFTPLGFQLRPRVTLRGAVTRAGEPVSRAEVVAHSDCRTYRTRTDAAGKFELSNLPARDYPVSAVSGFEGAQVTALLEAPGPLALELQKGGVLAGQVKDARGPLAGAEVVAIPRQPRGADEIRRVRTHRDGSFELGPMLPGKWQVEAIAAGHLSRPPAELRVVEGARQPLEVELAQATHIAGHVLGDTGTGLPDAEVEAVRSDADPGCVGCRLAVRTGPDGSFQLYPLAAGEYTVRAAHDRYLGAEARGVKPTDDLKLTLRPGAGLRGTIQDPDQPAAIHATASLRAADGTAVRPPRLVDPNGTFLLEGLAPGEYTLVVESADALPRRAETAVTLAAGASAGVDIALRRGTSISGKVVDDAGQPVAGATVQVIGGPGQGMAVVPASADGTFELKRLPPGKLRLSASREGFLAGPRSSAAADTGAGGARRVTLALSRLPAVKGRVRAPAGAAVD